MKKECLHFYDLTRRADYWAFDLPADLRSVCASKTSMAWAKAFNKRFKSFIYHYLKDTEATAKKSSEQDSVYLSAVVRLLAMLQDAPVRRLGKTFGRSALFKPYSLLLDKHHFDSFLQDKALDGSDRLGAMPKDVLYQMARVMFRRWIAFSVRVCIDALSARRLMGDCLPLKMNHRERLVTGVDRWVKRRDGTLFLDQDRPRMASHYVEAQVLKNPSGLQEQLVETIEQLRCLHQLLDDCAEAATSADAQPLPPYSSALSMVVYLSRWVLEQKPPDSIHRCAPLGDDLKSKMSAWVEATRELPFASDYLLHIAYRHIAHDSWAERGILSIDLTLRLGWMEYVASITEPSEIPNDAPIAIPTASPS